MNKRLNFTLIFGIFCALMLALSLRGLPGNPTSKELNTLKWKEAGPLELSPDRGRYSLLYSLAENGSFYFDMDIARFATPDLAISTSGKFVSLFAPALSYIVVPGYWIGKVFNGAQVGTFAVVALFAVANAILIRNIAMRLGADPISSTVGAAVFIFATPAFAYAVTIYQHHITVFMILSSIYALMKYQGIKPLLYIWFMCGLSISVDNPNLFLMFPIGVFALAKLFYQTQKENNLFSYKLDFLKASTLLIMIIPVGFFLWFNLQSNGNAFQLSGTLPQVKEIDASGKAINDRSAIEYDQFGNVKLQEDKSAVGSFETRNMLEGFRIHFMSLDRGIIWFTPVMIFGFFGLAHLYREKRHWANLLISIIGINILLYSMWGDPWGGWAFGSRYLIPAYSLLGVAISVALSKWRNKYWLLALFMFIAGYSVWVNTLGALTSNANPPKVEVLALEEVTGQIEKYTYERNWDLLQSNRSKSFLFQSYFGKYMTAPSYHNLIVSLINGLLIGLITWLGFENYSGKHKPILKNEN